jgi:hypothetical protein
MYAIEGKEEGSHSSFPGDTDTFAPVVARLAGR